MKITCMFCPAQLEINPGADMHQTLNSSLWAQIDLDMYSCGSCARQVLQPLSPNPQDLLSPDEQEEINNSRVDYMEKFYGNKR